MSFSTQVRQGFVSEVGEKNFKRAITSNCEVRQVILICLGGGGGGGLERDWPSEVELTPRKGKK